MKFTFREMKERSYIGCMQVHIFECITTVFNYLHTSVSFHLFVCFLSLTLSLSSYMYKEYTHVSNIWQFLPLLHANISSRYVCIRKNNISCTQRYMFLRMKRRTKKYSSVSFVSLYFHSSLCVLYI